MRSKALKFFVFLLIFGAATQLLSTQVWAKSKPRAEKTKKPAPSPVVEESKTLPVHDKARFKELVSPWQMKAPDLKQPWAKLRTQWEAPLKKLLAPVEQEVSFARGEIDDETLVTYLIRAMQTDFVRLKELRQKGDVSPVLQAWGLWLKMAADLAYEESSFRGLTVAARLRAIVLEDVVQTFREPKSPFVSRQSLDWFMAIRFPWPLDRTVLSESRRLFQGGEAIAFQGVARSLQQSPYVSLVQLAQKDPRLGSQAKAWAAEHWRDSDVQELKADLNRRSMISLGLAQLIFQREKAVNAHSFEELTSAGLISQIPLNYASGKPFAWAEVEQPLAGL